MDFNFADFARPLRSMPKKAPKVTKDSVTTELPKSRVSVPNINQSFIDIKNSVEFIKPDFQYEYIPVIRKLLRVNSSLSLAATTIVELANTGFTIQFDDSVSAEQRRAMLKRIDTVSKTWGHGVAGLHGLINKMIYQVYIGGAVSTEWVVNNDLSGIKNLFFINPEDVRFNYNRAKHEYEPYQVPTTLNPPAIARATKDIKQHIKLNPSTYSYYALIGDEDSPIGIPPFMSALDDIHAQLKMLKNIGYVSDQLGLMGFMEILLTKPSSHEGEGVDAYKTRLETLLTNTKDSVKSGLKDGILAGYEGDHEFEFHATTKDTAGVSDIFKINQSMVSNGLFSQNAFMNGTDGGAETGINIVFTKILSQLNNVQSIVSMVLERGITLDLLLAGFNFNTVKVKFKPSTITDELKTQQAREIMVRNNRTMYADGIINMDYYAEEATGSKPDQKKPRVEIDPSKVQADEVARKKKETDKDTGDRSTRDKKKNQPKSKPQDSRKR